MSTCLNLWLVVFCFLSRFQKQGASELCFPVLISKWKPLGKYSCVWFKQCPWKDFYLVGFFLNTQAIRGPLTCQSHPITTRIFSGECSWLKGHWVGPSCLLWQQTEPDTTLPPLTHPSHLEPHSCAASALQSITPFLHCATAIKCNCNYNSNYNCNAILSAGRKEGGADDLRRTKKSSSRQIQCSSFLMVKEDSEFCEWFCFV